MTIDVVDTLAEGSILELLAESETDPACNRRWVFLNEPGDLRGTNPIPGGAERRKLDSCLKVHPPAKRGANVFDGVPRVVLEQPAEVFNLNPDPMVFKWTVVEAPRLWVTLWRCDLVEIVSVLPPREIANSLVNPPELGDLPDPIEIPVPGVTRDAVVESPQNGGNIDEYWFPKTEYLGVSAVLVVSRVGDDLRLDGVEMNIRYGLAEVVLRVDHPRSVATLPQPPEITVPFVERPGYLRLEPQHRTPEGDGAGLDDQVVVLCGALGYVELATGRCVRLGLLQFRTPHNR